MAEDLDDVPRVQLPAAAQIDLTVHRHVAGRDQGLALAAGVGELRQLQELTESDHIAADRHLSHADILPKPAAEADGRLNQSAAGSELPVVKHLEMVRRAGVLAAGAVAGVLVAAGPAAADAAVSPTSAPQGSGANLTFRVTNTARSPITRVKLILPPDTPVAEVYPLSVDDWAPQITQRKLSHPLTTIHGGAPVTETAQAITWIAMPGRSVAPGRHADLGIALGPLPAVSRMSFQVQATYADGAAGPAMPPAVLTLTPAAAGRAPAHSGHAATATARGDDAAFTPVVVQADRAPSWWSIAGWIAAGLLTIGLVVPLLRSRRRPVPDPKAPDNPRHAGNPGNAHNPENAGKAEGAGDGDMSADEGGQEPVAAGARLRASSWRYSDTP